MRYDTYDNGHTRVGNDYQQGLLRGVLGADLRFNPHFRVYGEVGTGQVEGRRNTATANFQNDASLQQLFVDARGYAGATLVGAMIGRQEFADGPRQLISLSDGPNIRRTWNGVRFYAHGQRGEAGNWRGMPRPCVTGLPCKAGFRCPSDKSSFARAATGLACLCSVF